MVSRTSVHDCLHDNDASTLTATGSVAESERGLERGKRRGRGGNKLLQDARLRLRTDLLGALPRRRRAMSAAPWAKDRRYRNFLRLVGLTTCHDRHRLALPSRVRRRRRWGECGDHRCRCHAPQRRRARVEPFLEPDPYRPKSTWKQPALRPQSSPRCRSGSGHSRQWRWRHRDVRLVFQPRRDCRRSRMLWAWLFGHWTLLGTLGGREACCSVRRHVTPLGHRTLP